MFVYTFRNRLFLGQYRKMVLSFPLPESWRKELEIEGWEQLKYNDEWLVDWRDE